MSAPVRARAGQRINEAIAQIRLFEKAKVDWDAKRLAEAIGIGHQQANALVATLTVRGELEFADVIVKRRRLVLTAAAKSHTSKAA